MIPSAIAALATAIAQERGRDSFENEDIDRAYRIHKLLTDQGYAVARAA